MIEVKEPDLANDEINLNLIFNRILRNKYLVSTITIFSILVSFIIYLTTKKTWEGQFQIVLSTKKNTPALSLPSQLLDFQSLIPNESGNQLKTEVGILESPSVLMPIFEYVKSQSKNKKLNFLNWKKNNLDISLQRNTTILDISYQDTNKELIIEVLEKMSSKFQEYSGRYKSRDLKLVKTFLTQQIEIYKEKSAKSIKEAQRFGIEKNLVIGNELLSNPIDREAEIAVRGFTSVIPNIALEKTRVQVSDKKKNIEELIIKIKNSDNELSTMQNLFVTIPELSREIISNEEGFNILLKDYDTELSQLRLKYTEKDKTIQKLKSKMQSLAVQLKVRSLGILQAQKSLLDAKLKSLVRPEGVILKYKELIREAARDETTLVKLENELRSIQLEEAKLEDPWELITTPTLLDRPISPRLRYLGLLGLISGLSISLILITYKEKTTGLVYEVSIIKEYLRNLNLFKINLTNNPENQTGFKLFKDSVLEKEKVLLLTTFANNLENNLEYLIEILNKGTDENKFIIGDLDSKKLLKANYYCLLIDLNCLKMEELKIISNKLEISNKKIDSILVIE